MYIYLLQHELFPVFELTKPVDSLLKVFISRKEIKNVSISGQWLQGTAVFLYRICKYILPFLNLCFNLKDVQENMILNEYMMNRDTYRIVP